MIGIYAIYRKSDDKCMYVGESKNVEGRIYAHKIGHSHLKLNFEWYSKTVETFDFYDKENQLDREAYWINELNPELNETRNRQHSEEYKNNIRGENNPAKRPEVRKKLSDFAKTRKGETASTYNVKWSPETKQKMSEAAKEYHKLHPKCWMNNGIDQKTILLEKVQEYLDKGWVKGRLK